MTEKQLEAYREELEQLSNEVLLGADYLEDWRQTVIADWLAHEERRLNMIDDEELLGAEACAGEPIEYVRQAAIERLIDAKIREDEQ